MNQESNSPFPYESYFVSLSIREANAHEYLWEGIESFLIHIRKDQFPERIQRKEEAGLRALAQWEASRDTSLFYFVQISNITTPDSEPCEPELLTGKYEYKPIVL